MTAVDQPSWSSTSTGNLHELSIFFEKRYNSTKDAYQKTSKDLSEELSRGTGREKELESKIIKLTKLRLQGSTRGYFECQPSRQ